MKKFISKNQTVGILSLLVALVAGFFIGRLPFSHPGGPKGSVEVVHQNGSYKFINPLLLADFSDIKDFIELKSFEKKITDLVNQKKSENKAINISVYFRDFNSGHWTGVNEDDKFYPASLMKVPLMIAYFEQAISDPAVLTKKLTYDGKTDLNIQEQTKPLNPIKPREPYTVENLIRAMITDSDNNATNLLANNIDQNSFHEIYTDLNQSVPDSTLIGTADYLSPKQYSIYLRVLRNSTYLTRDFSEKALEIMSEANFKNGLVAGLPNNVTIAHKFGEFTATDSITGQNYYQLHDCGIVYYPAHNYLLCVMTKGLDRPNLESDIKDISSLVYNEVTSGYK